MNPIGEIAIPSEEISAMNNNSLKFFLLIATIGVALIMGLALRDMPPFWLWSITPLLLFAAFLQFRFRPIDSVFKKIYLLLLFFILAILPGSLHLLWLFDAGRIATGSSTSALIFVWIPLWCFVFSVPAILILEIVRLVFFREGKR
jgi:hypothetical protein